jgi:hypothetical protein
MAERRQREAASRPSIKFQKIAVEWGARMIPTPEEDDYFRALGREYTPPQAR